tara:strand:+ start:1097 stop:1666 length:570 start_codon:yes stop_codon:yes gene_type:complete
MIGDNIPDLVVCAFVKLLEKHGRFPATPGEYRNIAAEAIAAAEALSHVWLDHEERLKVDVVEPDNRCGDYSLRDAMAGMGVPVPIPPEIKDWLAAAEQQDASAYFKPGVIAGGAEYAQSEGAYTAPFSLAEELLAVRRGNVDMFLPNVAPPYMNPVYAIRRSQLYELLDEIERLRKEVLDEPEGIRTAR